MSSTSEHNLRVSEVNGCEALSPSSRALFSGAQTRIFQSGAWWEHFERHGVPAGDRLRMFVAEDHGHRPIAVFPAIFSRLYVVHPRARLLHFMGPEGMPYEPILAPGCPDPGDTIDEVIEFVRSDRLQYDVLRFSPLGPDSPFLARLSRALREHRYGIQSYRIHGDRYETTAGQSSMDYLTARPMQLRERLGSTGRMLFESGRASFALIREPADVDSAWIGCEPILTEANEQIAEFAEYLPGLMRIAAKAGVMRLGIITLDGQPAAMQLWVIAGKVAHCLRISQLRRIDLPLDDMVTERITSYLIDEDRVVELDFGYIVDQFGADWAPRTRRRVGIIAFNTHTSRGLKGALRHILLPKLLALPRRVRRKLRSRSA